MSDTTSNSSVALSAIVLNWNGGDETSACLNSLAEVSWPQITVVLADNGSVDGSADRLAAEHEQLVVLRHGSNLGFAEGNNRALAHAFDVLGADWACLLNSDVLVTPEIFRSLLDAAQTWEAQGKGEVGALGPVLMYRDRPDVVWARGGKVGPKLNVTQLLGHGEAHVAARSIPEDVDYLPGTCLLISRKAWETVGGLDEQFFCYLEDADWGVRMHKAGLATLVVPAALAYHGLSSSTGGGYTAGRKYMTAVNSVHFLRKHGSWRGWAGLLVFDVMLWPLALVRALLSGRAPAAWAKLRGVFDGLRGVHVDAAVAARYARRLP